MIAVAFAYESVLAHDSGLARAAFLRVVDEVGHNERKSADAFEASASFDRALAAVSAGRERLDEAVTGALASVFGPSTSLPDLAAAYRRTVFEMAPDFIHPSAQTARTLRELEHLAIPHAMLTAGWSKLRQRKADIVGFTGAILAPLDAGANEGSKLLRELNTALAVPLDRIFFVGADLQRDIEPAQRAGMQAVWLRNGRDDSSGRPAAPYQIDSLEDILEILREPYTRSLLGLRYILHDVAGWRPGKFMRGSEYGLGEPKV